MMSMGWQTLTRLPYPCAPMVCIPFDRWCRLVQQSNQLHCREPSTPHCCRSAWAVCSCRTCEALQISWQRWLSSASPFSCCSPSPSTSAASIPSSSPILIIFRRRKIPSSSQAHSRRKNCRIEYHFRFSPAVKPPKKLQASSFSVAHLISSTLCLCFFTIYPEKEKENKKNPNPKIIIGVCRIKKRKRKNIDFHLLPVNGWKQVELFMPKGSEKREKIKKEKESKKKMNGEERV